MWIKHNTAKGQIKSILESQSLVLVKAGENTIRSSMMSGVWAYLSAAISGHIKASNKIRLLLRAVIIGLFESLQGLGARSSLTRQYSVGTGVSVLGNTAYTIQSAG